MALEPITRQEKIIAGQDLTPITRMEKFLKEFGGSGGSGGAQPDWNAAEGKPGHILNRPFYSEVVESVDVEVKEQTITSVTNSSGKHSAKLYNKDTGLVATKDNTHVIVVFDGELFDLRSNNNLLGNRAILGVAGAVDTGEPFYIGTGNSVTNIHTKTPGDHTIAITVYKEETVYHTIDPKFIPAGVGGGVVIVQDSAMASGVMPAGQAAPTATMNAAQIAEAVLSGKTVYFLEPNNQALLPFVCGYRFGEMASGVMTAASSPDPFALFGSADEEGWYVGVKVVLDGAYYTFYYGIKTE